MNLNIAHLDTPFRGQDSKTVYAAYDTNDGLMKKALRALSESQKRYNDLLADGLGRVMQ
jgi:hypothetical protein